MYLSRRVRIQFVLFIVISLTAALIMMFGYMKLPAQLFGIGHYTVTVELAQSGGLYPRGNVTYRGTEVGEIQSVRLTKTGAAAVLSLKSDQKIPSDLDAQVHSQSAIGELYIALLPRNGSAPPLKDGDVIPASRTSVPPDINSLLDATNRGLAAVPRANLKTAIDESYTAINGLGPELSRIVKGSTQIAIDARHNLDPLTSLIDQSQPVLDAQSQSADEIQAWAAHLATITDRIRAHDSSVAGILQNGPAAADESRQLLERFQPTLPLLLANLVSVGQIAIKFQPGLEQLLVLLPQGLDNLQGIVLANRNTKQAYKGAFMSFNLNINLPPPCTTGYLPVQQQRPPSFEDSPDRTEDDLYCRVPQDNPIVDVRGARNFPCLTVPGKRAPTEKMCESDHQYVPLNDGFNWKGDPNATLSGQGIPERTSEFQPTGPTLGPPQPPPAAPPPQLPAAVYDPATGTYTGPDGKVYTQSDLAQQATPRTWQDMLIPQTNR